MVINKKGSYPLEVFQEMIIQGVKNENFKIYKDNCYKIPISSFRTSSSSGNLVDGLPLVCSTETAAKPGRLGPAKNGTTPPQNDRVSKVLIDEAYEDVKKTMSSVC